MLYLCKIYYQKIKCQARKNKVYTVYTIIFNKYITLIIGESDIPDDMFLTMDKKATGFSGSNQYI
jgi:hypothetical protein